MRWRIPRYFAWVEPENDTAENVWVLNADRNMIFGMTTAALIIWRACESAPDTDAVIDSLVAEQGWNRDEVAEPVEQFVHILVEQGFLEEAGV